MVSLESMLAGHLDGRNMVHLLKIRPFMRRCSPERMFPSSQWWRCRCYIDTFLLWDSPREFPTSSTAYHSNLYIAPSELFSVTWHRPEWRRELREISQNDLTPSELRSSGFVNYSLLDWGDPAHDATCHQLYGQYRSSRFKWVDLSSWPAIAWNCGIWQMPPVRK